MCKTLSQRSIDNVMVNMFPFRVMTRKHHPSTSRKEMKKGPRCWYGESTDHRSTVPVVKFKQSHGFQSNGLYVSSYIYYDLKIWLLLHEI